MHKMIFISVLVLFSILLAACGGGTATSTDTPAAQVVNINLESNPEPATTGEAELIFTVTDAQGNPIEDATVDVSADHTDMTGMGMSGPATDQGSGKYAINANFSMSGNWRLTVYVRKEGLDYKEDIDFTVQ